MAGNTIKSYQMARSSCTLIFSRIQFPIHILLTINRNAFYKKIYQSRITIPIFLQEK
jgi:hypothetical protein